MKNKKILLNSTNNKVLLLACFCFALLNSYGQCTTGCSPNLAPNFDAEQTTVECVDSTNSEMFTDYAQVQDWFGTACQTCPGNGSTPDYYNASCSGNAGETTCDGSSGAMGVFTKVLVFGAPSDAREYVQAQLSSPLVAGQEYCVSVNVKNGGSSYTPTDGFGIWFTDQMVDIDTQNNGDQYIGPGSTINATPQIQNPAGNFIDNCTTITGTFCATGNEEWIVLGNFKNGANTQFDPACGTGFCSGYVIMDNISVTAACTNTSLTVSDDTLNCGQSVDVELQNTPSGATIEWLSPAGFTGYATAGPHNDTPTGNTDYTAVIETTNSCGVTTEDTLTQTVIVDCGPQVDITATEDTICVGSCSDLSANISGGLPPYTVTWNNSLPANSGPHNVCPTSTETYYVDVVDNNGDTATDTITVVVNPLPSVDAGADVTICSGSSHDLLATGAQSYTWDNGIGVGAGPHTVNPTSTTTYTVTGTDANGCVNTDNVTVTIDNNGPSINFSASDVTCNGGSDGSVTANANGNGPFSYDWTPTGGTSSTENNLNAGDYIVEVTDNNGCSTTDTITINEPDTLDLNMSVSATDCSTNNGSASVSVNGGTGTYTYSWAPNGETTSSINGLSAGTYIVTVEDQNGCQATDTAIVETANGPEISLDNLQDISCPGDEDGSISITVNGGNPGYTYSWSPAGGTSSTASNLAPGNYEVTVTDNNGCTAVANYEINEPNPIVINPMVADANCSEENGVIQLNSGGGTGALNFDWDTNSTNSDTISNLAPGQYDVTISDQNGCSIDTTITVGVTGSIPVSTQPQQATIDLGDEVPLDTDVNGASNLNFQWTPSEGLSCDNCPNPIASPSSTTTYVLTVTSPDGCTGSDSTKIFVNLPCEGAFLPSMFSPNNDGVNDELCILSNCVKSMNLEIFNRWGELVFKSTDTGTCWDGTYKSKKVNGGSYVYKLNVTLTNQKVVEKSGTITVVL